MFTPGTPECVQCPGLRALCRESYNEPLAVYRQLKRQGMDLVTVTDHDSIDAAEPLRRFPDFFLSEEVTCRMPSGTELHVGVYDITERQHVEIQRRRHDLGSLAAFLSANRLLFSANHVFSSLTGRRTLADFEFFDRVFPAMETRNGLMPRALNARAEALASWMRKAAVGGSDAHAMPSVGRAFTEVLSAHGKADFLEGVRRGHARVVGTSGNWWKLTRDVLLIGASMAREDRWKTVLAPLALAVPFVTAANSILEEGFARLWMRRLRRARDAKSCAAPLEAAVRLFQPLRADLHRNQGPRSDAAGPPLAPFRWIRLWMICATRGGDGWIWYAMGLIILILGGPERFAAVASSALATAVGIAIFLVLKKKTGRRRPCAIEPHCWSTLLPPDQFSFPSGHTITAFAVTVSLGMFYPPCSPDCCLSPRASQFPASCWACTFSAMSWRGRPWAPRSDSPRHPCSTRSPLEVLSTLYS